MSNRRRIGVPILDLSNGFFRYRLEPHSTREIRIEYEDLQTPESIIGPAFQLVDGLRLNAVTDERGADLAGDMSTLGQLELRLKPRPVLQLVDAGVLGEGGKRAVLVTVENVSDQPLDVCLSLIVSVAGDTPLTAAELLTVSPAVIDELLGDLGDAAGGFRWRALRGDFRGLVSTIENCRIRFQGEVGPLQSMTFRIEPGQPWRANRLTIARESGAYFQIDRIRVGLADQMGPAYPTAVPAAIFEPSSDARLEIATCSEGLALSVEVRNTTDQPRICRGWWEGSGPNALSIRGAEPIPQIVRYPIAIRLDGLQMGEHRRFVLKVAPDSDERLGTVGACPTRLLIARGDYDRGARLVGVELDGKPCQFEASVDDVTDEPKPWGIHLFVPELDEGQELVLIFAHVGDENRPIDFRAALLVSKERAPAAGRPHG